MNNTSAVALLVLGTGIISAAGAQQATPRRQPGAEISLYAPEQHDLYDGRFVVSATRLYQVGGLRDTPGWDHIDNEATTARAVEGTVEIDVNEIQNTGRFVARARVAEGELVLEIARFHEFSPCQDGGVAAYIYEHGDSGCGDTNWPKTFIFLAGWGYGHATLNGEILYENHQMHFMVTQGIRDRETLQVNYPLPNKKSAAGAVNPAAQQLDSTFEARKRIHATTRQEPRSTTSLRWRSLGGDRGALRNATVKSMGRASMR